MTTKAKTHYRIKIKRYQIYHNYIREHEGLNGKTPAEACGITLEGENKWKSLIENASQNKA
jgi:putative transposase